MEVSLNDRLIWPGHGLKMIILAFLIFPTGCTYSKIYSSSDFALLEKADYLSRIDELDDEIIIDVRTPLEYSKGHIDKAINISFLGFSFEERELELNTSKPIFIYCETAHRSPYVMRKLKKLGFKKVFDLKKGYSVLRE